MCYVIRIMGVEGLVTTSTQAIFSGKGPKRGLCFLDHFPKFSIDLNFDIS